MPGFRPLCERVFEKVDRRGPHECWLWTGAVTPGKQGRPFVHLHLDENGKQVTAHASRAMFMIAYGVSPDGKHVHHACGNRMCVNPQHLRLLAPGDHMKEHTITHCKRAGHEFTPENTRIDKRGARFCRACEAARARRLRTTKLDEMRAYEREYARKKRAKKRATSAPSG